MELRIKTHVTGKTSPQYGLHFELRNESKGAIKTYEGQLPWNGWQSLVLVAVETTPGGTVLDRTLPVNDPGPAQIEIGSGQALQGEINLESLFPAFRDSLRKRDVLVFWSYQFQPLDHPALPRTSGYVLFAKTA